MLFPDKSKESLYFQFHLVFLHNEKHNTFNRDSSHLPWLRKWLIVVLWRGLFFAISVIFPLYPEQKMEMRILIKWRIILLEKYLHKWICFNCLYKKEESCIVFARDIFFREFCIWLYYYFHYTIQRKSGVSFLFM